MYEGQQFCPPGLVSGADLSAATVQYKLVKFSTAPAVVLCSDPTDEPCGVLQAPTPTSATGQPVQVCQIGVTKVQGDGTTTVGDHFGPDANGQALKNVWGTDKTHFIAGTVINRDAAGAAGSYLTAIINCANPPKAVASA